METGFLHGTSVFKSKLLFVILLSSFLIPLSFRVGTGHAYAAEASFTTYGAGVLSGHNESGVFDVVSEQPAEQPYNIPTSNVFTSTLIQPGIVSSPPPILPDFTYGGILSSGDYKITYNGTYADAYAKNFGNFTNSIPDLQRFIDVAKDISTVCGGSYSGCSNNCKNILKSCNFNAGIYKADLCCINLALGALNKSTEYKINSSGLVILVQADISNPSDSLNVVDEVTTTPTDRRLVVVTNRPIVVSAKGEKTLVNDVDFISQGADIQAMFITSYLGSPSLEVQDQAHSISMEGPIVSKGNISFKRVNGTPYPGPFIKFNPLYAAELAKLSESLSIFGSSSVRWSYE